MGSTPIETAIWAVSSAGRTPALQAGGHRFDPVCLHQFTSVKCTCVASVFKRSESFVLIFNNLEIKVKRSIGRQVEFDESLLVDNWNGL